MPRHNIVAASLILGLLVACGGPPTSPPSTSPPFSLPPGADSIISGFAGEVDVPTTPPPTGPDLPAHPTGPGVSGLWFPPEPFAAFSLSQSGSVVSGDFIVDEYGSTCGDLSGSASGSTLTLTLIITHANCPFVAELDAEAEEGDPEIHRLRLEVSGQVQGDNFVGEVVFTAEGYYRGESVTHRQTERAMLRRIGMP